MTDVKLLTYQPPLMMVNHPSIESRVVQGILRLRHVNSYGVPAYDTWWSYALPFCHGYAIVQRARERKYRIINMRGTLVSNHTFHDIGRISNHGVVRVLHGKCFKTARWKLFNLWNRTFEEEA